MKVSIVIPNWNGRELMEKNMSGVIKAYKNPNNKIGEIIVVDDKSTDESVAFLQKNYADDIKLVRHTKNRGFSSAVNTGARTAKGELVCLLNTDVVPSEDFLVSVHKHFKDSKVFGVSLHEEGFSGYAKGVFKGGYIELVPGEEAKKVKDTFWISGGSGVFRRKTWMELKGMDEKLLSPYYWEDLDLSYRALKRGYRLIWDPKAVVDHKHEGTMVKLNQKKLNRIRERNQLLVIWKNITSKNMMKKHRMGILRRIRKGPGYLRIVLMAAMKISVVLTKRKIEKRAGKVSDEAIFGRFG